MTWTTIDKEKLEAEIETRSAVLDVIRRGRTSIKDPHEAAHYLSKLAEHNALVAVFNSLN